MSVHVHACTLYMYVHGRQTAYPGLVSTVYVRDCKIPSFFIRYASESCGTHTHLLLYMHKRHYVQNRQLHLHVYMCYVYTLAVQERRKEKEREWKGGRGYRGR